MTSMSFTIPNRNSDLIVNLNEYRKNGHLCDVTFLIDGQELRAHRVILAASSQYFSVMFGNQFQEGKSNVVCMKDVEYSAMQRIFDFIYTSKIELTEEDILSVMEAADILQILALRQVITHFVKKTLNIKNCLIVYATAKFRDYVEAADTAFRYVVENFEEVCKGNSYNELPANVWRSILDSDVLNVPDENYLLEVLMKWYQHSTETRLADFNHLSSFINLTKISPAKLEQHLQFVKGTELHIRITAALDCQSRIERGDSKIKMVVDEQKYMNKMNDLKLEVNHKKERYAKYNYIILVTGGSDSASPECFTRPGEPWSFKLPTWGPFAPLDDSQLVIPANTVMAESAGTGCNNEMFVIGGFSNMVEPALDSCYRYDVTENRWHTMAPLQRETSGAAAAVCDNTLYVTGGVNDFASNSSVNTVLQYHTEQDGSIGRWVEVSPMLEARAGHELCSVNGELFAIGGVSVTTSPCCPKHKPRTLSSVERYCPLANVWRPVSPMLRGRAWFSCAAVDEFIYVFGGCHYALPEPNRRGGCTKMLLGDSERYNTLTDSWEPLQSQPFVAREGACATSILGKVYLFGGADTTGRHYNSVHCYNPETGRWQYAHPLHFERVRAAAATLALPVKYRCPRDDEKWIPEADANEHLYIIRTSEIQDLANFNEICQKVLNRGDS